MGTQSTWGVSTQRSLKMRLIWTSLALVLASLWHVQGYTCPPGKSKKTITLGVGESVDFSTQDADSYGKNVKCVVKFKKAKKAKCELNFSCSAFTLTAKTSNCNRGSDFLKIGKEKFCEDNSPDVTVAGRTLNVLFRSNERSKGGEGAECEATCVDPDDETPTTVAPPATTPTPPVTTAAPTTGIGGLPSITPGPIETYTRVRFRLFPGLGASLEALDFDGVNIGLSSSTRFNPAKPLKVVAHGWGGSTLSNGQVQVEDDMARTYANTYEDVNMDVTVIGVHWVPRDGWEGKNVNASGDAANTVALLLYALAKDYGVSPSNTQMIGFSMGTIVTSKTGKRTLELGLPQLARLTLLDPCPAEEALVVSLSDGEYVEAMHTSSQDICSTEPLAHVDFYPNGGLAQVCGDGSCSCSGGASVCDSCYFGKPRCTGFWAWGENHGRAVELYRESIEATQGRGTTFLSWKCSMSYSEMIANSESCPYDGTSQLVPMGEDVLTNGRPADGVYFLTTNGEEPRSYNSYEQWIEN